MGMFDKDKEIGLILQNTIPQGKQFIVFSAEIVREDFPTKLGPATQSQFEVAYPETPNDRMTVTTLAGAIANKVREAEPDDFPAVVFWTSVPVATGMATVLQFVGPWGGGKRAAFRDATGATLPTPATDTPADPDPGTAF